MRALETFAVMAAMSLLLLGWVAVAWSGPEFDNSDDDPTLPQRSPQAYYVPDQDELQQLPVQPAPNQGWGWLRRALSGPSRVDQGRDDSQHDPNLDQGP